MKTITIEAPRRSGKTRNAIYRANRLVEKGGKVAYIISNSYMRKYINCKAEIYTKKEFFEFPDIAEAYQHIIFDEVSPPKKLKNYLTIYYCHTNSK
jgi:predicted AAA+ superfamily ATPase